MATGPRYNVAFRRRRETRTDYYVRKKLLRSGETRAIVRRSNKNITIQFADFDMGGDLVVASATSRVYKYKDVEFREVDRNGEKIKS